MSVNIEKLSLREIGRMEEVFSEIQILEDSKIFLLAESYFKDSKFFFEKGEYLNAFEAVIISWAYVDSLLHFGKVDLPKELKHLFTA